MLNETQLDFRESMGRLATGVTIVMTEMEGRPWGLTVSACCSISMEPPLILVSLASKAASVKAILQQEQFSVSVLAEGQAEVARAGAAAGVPKFFEAFTKPAGPGRYSVSGALANVHCRVYQTLESGDHTLFIGLVEQVELGERKSPLLHFDRQFGEFAAIR